MYLTTVQGRMEARQQSKAWGATAYLAAQEEALRVEVEGHVPLALGRVLGRVVEVDARVVHCNVQPAQL